jgi:Dolichyl-phosphate-mannose-protein mannosyltransferase
MLKAQFSLPLNERSCVRAAQIILVIVSVLVLLTFRHYGITWDEELQSQYGLAVVDYYLSLFKDQRFTEIFNLYIYGGMFDGLASIVDRFTPYSVYETRHLMNGIVGIVGLWGTWRLGRFIGGGAVGLLSLILLVLTPMYYGHMFNNPKDIPFAAGVVWSLYYMARVLADGHRPRLNLIIKLGIVYGLTLGVRVGGVMLFGFWLVPIGIHALKLWREPVDGFRKAALYKIRLILPVALIAYVVMLFCWPWAQLHPLMNPLRALGEFSNFPQNVEVLLHGTIYMSTQLPWYYVPLYFGVQLPLMLLLLLASALILLPWIMRALSEPRRQALLLVLLTAFTAPAYAMIHHPALYDCVRHFLFAVPMFCILAALAARHIYAISIEQFWQIASRRMIAAGLTAAFLISCVTQIVVMIELHPYEYIYANELTGGVNGAYGYYELDYWGSSFKEAAKDLQKYVATEGGIPDGKIYRIAICGPWDSAMIYLPPDYQPVVANQKADFFLSTTRWMCQNMRPGRDIISVDRMGVPLSIIKDLRGGYEKLPKSKPKPKPSRI